MQFSPEEQAGRWLGQAKLDLDDARYNLEGGRFSLVCFLAQQAAEKALKAFVYARGGEPWGHSAAMLCDAAAQFDSEFAAVKRELAPLDKYYASTRYPDALPGGLPSEAFDANDARSALRLAERALALAESKLKGSPGS